MFAGRDGRTLGGALAEYDESRRGWLGLAIERIPEAIAPTLQLGDTKGALVAMVERGSPAERSGLEVGDVVSSFDGTPVQDASGFFKLLTETDVGQSVTITVLRGGKQQLLQATLGEVKTRSPTEPETSSTDESVDSDSPGQGPDAAGGEASESPTEDLDAHLFDEYFKDFVTSQR